MALARDTRLARIPELPQDAVLTPEEFFVLTRIEGRPSVGEVLASAGMPRAEAERILERLVELGLVHPAAEAPARVARPLAARPAPLGLRAKVEQRRRVMLRAELRQEPSSPTSPPPAPAPAEPTVEGGDEEGTDEDAGFVLPMVARDDSRLDPEAGLGLEEQRWLLALADGQHHLSPFEFLGLEPTHDLKRIRRAFHRMSRRLHPDAYYGRPLGRFGPLVTELFRRAKFYFEELRSPEVRAPYVEQRTQAQAERERQRSALQRDNEAVEAYLRAQAEEEAAQRRQRRAEMRAARERLAVRKRMQEAAETHMRDAEAALVEGNLARAANAYRLALQCDPDSETLRQRWKECRQEAQRRRAEEAYRHGRRHLEVGQPREALPLLVEAAQADPRLEYLVAAADVLLDVDAAQARDFAMAAFDALVTAKARGEEPPAPKLAAMHVTIGRAFFAVGQKESAKQQALAARHLRPDDPDVRALLKALNLK